MVVVCGWGGGGLGWGGRFYEREREVVGRKAGEEIGLVATTVRSIISTSPVLLSARRF